MKPTQEQVIAWARESHMQSHHARDVWAGHIVNLENVAALAYEAGRKDEREWQGLTDEEIMDACSSVWASHPIEVGRVVQDLLRKKNT